MKATGPKCYGMYNMIEHFAFHWCWTHSSCCKWAKMDHIVFMGFQWTLKLSYVFGHPYLGWLQFWMQLQRQPIWKNTTFIILNKVSLIFCSCWFPLSLVHRCLEMYG